MAYKCVILIFCQAHWSVVTKTLNQILHTSSIGADFPKNLHNEIGKEIPFLIVWFETIKCPNFFDKDCSTIAARIRNRLLHAPNIISLETLWAKQFILLSMIYVYMFLYRMHGFISYLNAINTFWINLCGL